MSVSLEGGCSCGAVRYRLASEPLFTHCCHCLTCQRQTGSAFVINLLIETDRVEVLAGVPQPVDVPRDDGSKQRIFRCPACQVAVFSQYGRAEFRYVRAGTLDRPSAVAPDVHIFVKSKLGWVVLPDSVPAFDVFYDTKALWPASSLERLEAALATPSSQADPGRPATTTDAIRPLVESDAGALLRLWLENREFLAPSGPARTDDYFTLETQREIARNESGLSFAILDDGELAGVIALNHVSLGALRSANVGYWVDAARNGRGLASRAVAALAEHAFGELELHRLEAGTAVDNLASQRVLEKNGFERIGLARSYLLIGGEWRDHVLFQRTNDGSE
jgi:RimJ/RimL family protein N-acetyltransferase